MFDQQIGTTESTSVFKAQHDTNFAHSTASADAREAVNNHIHAIFFCVLQ
jgi:hypothetical protein